MKWKILIAEKINILEFKQKYIFTLKVPFLYYAVIYHIKAKSQNRYQLFLVYFAFKNHYKIKGPK